MVEMIRMLHKTYILFIAALLAAGSLRAQQVAPRIAGLEGNQEYMTLLEEDARLQEREDSVIRAVEGLRQLLREKPDNRQEYSQQILHFEGRIFDIRNAKGRLIDRINTIEQDWVLSNLDRPGGVQQPAVQPAMVVPDSLKVRRLIDNPPFRRELLAEDYAALRKAQMLEPQAVDYVNRYFANHAQLTALAQEYALATVEVDALAVLERFNTLQGMNKVLADSLSESWNYIFDNKNYSYNFLLDRMGRDDMLTREEEALSDAMRELSTLSGQTASDVVADYFVRKKVLVNYEIALAEALALTQARDSLRGVAAQLAGIDFRLPKAVIEERTFIEYQPLEFSSATPYTTQNPIPECRVYPKGTIYRVLLGRFATKRAASLFRGAYPLCYQIDEQSKWCYYAGGFATLSEAEAVEKQLKAKGFVRPEIVLWIDGQMRNLTRDPQPTITYRVEIGGSQALSDAVKGVIAASAEGHELSRVGQQMFVVGAFDDRVQADSLAVAIRRADAALEIKVAESAE